MEKTSMHGMWSSRLAFILAATGSAVGLGNIWRFPYITSENGGGAFVLIYLLCILVVGLPVMISEITIGRLGRMSPVNTFSHLTAESNAKRGWVAIPWLGIVAGFLVLSFYSVVAGWTLHYAFLYAKQLFGGTAISDPDATFGALLGNTGLLTFWHALFMGLTLGVVACGVEKGLERAVTVLMPLLLVLLLILLGYGMSQFEAFMQGAGFLFRPDWSQVSSQMVVEAMGQAFFTLSLGMCAIMTYGAYLPAGVSIPRVAGIVAVADTAVALLAGLAIFPIVISYGIDPKGGGAGLIFTSLPLAFNDMPFGIAYGFMFFLLLAVAAWTSSISLLEPATAYLVERTGLGRKLSALIIGALAWLAGMASVLGFTVFKHVKIGERDIMDTIEHTANDFMMPLGGMLIAVFAGWVLSRRLTRKELGSGMPAALFTAWLWLVRIVTPLLVLVVLASMLDLI